MQIKTTVWLIPDNKKIDFDFIEVFYMFKQKNQIQIFHHGFNYPNQVWNATKVNIYSNQDMLTYDNCTITINYDSDWIIE